MKVLVLGLRGIPDVQGGVETHAQHLCPRLARRGCQMQVLVRTAFVAKDMNEFAGVTLKRIWAPRTQGVEALVHSILGILYAAIVRPDIVHIHAVGPGIVTPLARMLGLSVVVTHHGPDYDRDKWGVFARAVLRLGEKAGMNFSNARIAISRGIADSIRERYAVEAAVIPNGVLPGNRASEADQLARFGLEPRKYFVHVGRFVPEKRHLDLIRAYRAIGPCSWKLALVGAPADDDYSRRVTAEAKKAGAVLTGYLNGASLQQVYSHAGAFVLPSSHEGLPIALLEALSYGLPTLVSAIPANLEIGLEASSYFPLGDLRELERGLMRLVTESPSEDAVRQRMEFVTERFDWDQIADQTVKVYRSALRQTANR